jgi:uncharacterized SAM-binding protein YcdF (DUF218 family)
MFFILSKVFQFLFSPLTWILILLIPAVIIHQKKPKTAKKMMIVAFIMLLFFTNPFILYEAMRAYEVDAVRKEELRKNYDYAILLSGMLTYDDYYDRINFQRSADRLMQTLDLYHEGRVKKIFITGGSGEIFNQKDKEAIILKDYLIKIGIPEEDILVESNSRNTYENAKESVKVLPPDKGYTFLLITSAFHMRRAVACFKKQGYSFDTYVTDRYAGKRRWNIDLFVPKAEILSYWAILFREIGGLAAYKITGKI